MWNTKISPRLASWYGLSHAVKLAFICIGALAPHTIAAQQPSTPIAIVPINQKNPPVVTGAMEVSSGHAMIANSGSITAGDSTAEVTLPHRGKLLVCATTTVKLAAGTADSVGELPGLMLALERGALETSFATGRNSDVILTPDFRILIGSPGASQVKVRLGEHGDTCVDNPGPANPNQDAPYVIVTSVFEGGAYRVQPGQRVMFQHGSTREVVDNEKEPCGCPPPPKPDSNDFPLAQSAGLAPLPKPATGGTTIGTPGEGSKSIAPLIKNGGEMAAKSEQTKTLEQTVATPTSAKMKPAKKPGFFSRVGHFFRQVFGAE